MTKLERDFQKNLKKEISSMFPGCVISKLDSSDPQGIPDLLILHEHRWAILECKRDAKAPKQPNQDHYVEMFNTWSFSAFIYPENKEEVLYELERAWQS